jgi:hypothetical protein
MDTWSGLRTALVIAVWVAVLGGVVMAAIWFGSGGSRAVGPDDEMMADAGVPIRTERRRVTGLTPAQVGMHGLLGILTAAVVTYAATFDGKRSDGYYFVVIALVVTAAPGLAMFLTWRSGRRPRLRRSDESTGTPRVEDRLPSPVVYFHGLAVVATLGIVIALLLVDR